MPFTKDDPNINRKGRPKKDTSINERVRKFFEGREGDTDSGKQKKRVDLLISDIWKNAKNGDFQAQKYLMDRLGGRPAEKIEVSGDEDKPIGIVFLPTPLTPEQWIDQHGGNTQQGDTESMEPPAKTEVGT